MIVTLLGVGCGGAGTLTVEGRRALAGADYLLGAERLLAGLPPEYTCPRRAATRPEEVLALLLEGNCRRPCVLYSGDTGFYSGARRLLPLLKERGIEARVLPGISSLQYFAALLGRPWQDWKLCSAHGVDCDPVRGVMEGRPVFFLTGGALDPAGLCRRLCAAGLGALEVTVGEELSCPGERVLHGRAEEFACRTFAPLSVLLAEPAPGVWRGGAGIEDGAFLRGQTPMTKQEVRAAVLAKLAVGPEDLCWDIGAGTGSVSVELALRCREVWAVERDPDACALCRANRERFGAWNLRLVEGEAPGALEGLPRPDAVFVGGSGGNAGEILQTVRRVSPAARVCLSAITLETLTEAFQALTALGYETEVTQISVSRTREAGGLHLLLAQNPVFLITGAAK